MSFRPFGDHFDIRSALPPDQAKAAIRNKLVGWFAPKTAARGWIVGPFICLWLSGLNDRGPMLLGRIVKDEFGSRVSGRAGSDLNGMVLYLILLSAMIATGAKDWARHGEIDRGILFWTGILSVVGVLMLWVSHLWRKEATPLIRFLEKQVGTRPRRALRKMPLPQVTGTPRLATLNLSGEMDDATPDAERLAAAFKELEDDLDGFLIVAMSDDEYIQTAHARDGFVLERRAGNEATHMVARLASNGAGYLSPGIVQGSFLRYLYAMPDDVELVWHPRWQ